MRYAWIGAVLLGSTGVLLGQTTKQAPEGSRWERVQAIEQGTPVEIATQTRHLSCTFESAGPDSITCKRGSESTVVRSEILTVKIAHRVRSGAIALAIGAGVGVGVGAAIGEPGSFIPRGKAATAFGAAFGVIGFPIGYATDFSKSTVYRAPGK